MTENVLRPDFRAQCDAAIDRMIDQFYAAVPSARHLQESASIDIGYFKRHTIETVLRIRLARIADGKVITEFAKTNPVAARAWAKYAEEEMLHDRMFVKDLESLGVRAEEVYGTEPLVATKLLQGYIYYVIEHEGPIGLITKSYFVEYATRKTQHAWNRNVAKSLGERAVKGAEAHLSYDTNEDHSAEVWNVLASLIRGPEDEARVLRHLKVYGGLFGAYFQELHATVTERATSPMATAPIAAVQLVAAE